MLPMTDVHQSAESLADAVIDRLGRRIVLGLPVGIGKAVHVADALFERARRDRTLSLTIFTGLTLEKPVGESDLEARFIAPFADRLYADWPTPQYAEALREGQLPSNVTVHEFFLRPGAWLGNPLVQQSYTSVNYSQVAGTLRSLGINLIAQLVSVRAESPDTVSLGSNPEVTLDLLPYFEAMREQNEPVAIVGQTNRQMPWMSGAAERPRAEFDFLLDDGNDFPLFGLPARMVTPADYAAGMYVASLVPDGGTLQLGIGSLSEAVAHCLRVRHENPDLFSRVFDRLSGGAGSARKHRLSVHRKPFKEGLFASTELLSDALFSLVEAGIVRRPAGEGDDSIVHAGFFVGSVRLYEKLRSLDEEARRRLRMSGISEVNTLFGDEARKRRQRRSAVFVNETMMVTLNGAAVSDGLDDGRVVSGVGGQFDFVAMAQALHDARSLLVFRATRKDGGRLRSNVHYSYAHATVPRHYRDIFVSEYGIAATRGLSDHDVMEELLGITDAAFHDGLVASARKAGKLPQGYRVPAEFSGNTPDAVRAVFSDKDVCDHFPDYPLGSDFTEEEQSLVRALAWLRDQSDSLPDRLRLAASALGADPHRYEVPLERMELARPRGIRERLKAQMLAHALRRTKK